MQFTILVLCISFVLVSSAPAEDDLTKVDLASQVSKVELGKINTQFDRALESVRTGELEDSISKIVSGTELEKSFTDKKKVQTTKDVFAEIFGDGSGNQANIRDLLSTVYTDIIQSTTRRTLRPRTRPNYQFQNSRYGTSSTTTESDDVQDVSSSTPLPAPAPSTASTTEGA